MDNEEKQRLIALRDSMKGYGYADGVEELESIFPELRESDDERIRRTLAEYFGPEVQLDLVRGVPIQKIRDWLEKQKENPKNADSIPPDCASNARCPYKIHGDRILFGDIKDTPAYHFGFDEGVRSEREKQKEQMMKKAVDGFVYHCAHAHYVCTDQVQRTERLKQFQHGDKVKVIIVRSDETSVGLKEQG